MAQFWLFFPVSKQLILVGLKREKIVKIAKVGKGFN